MTEDARRDPEPRSADAGSTAISKTLPVSAGNDVTELSPSGRTGRASAPGLELATVDRARYVVRQELARGGMGKISIADDRALGRTVAIKEVLVDAPDYEARFHRELALTARLQHPGIVTVHDGGLWSTGALVYIMRLVSGESLEIRSARCQTLDDRIALVPNLIAAVDALAYAHSQGIIHRDLKPANIMVGDFGETVVIDWGLAKELRGGSAEPRSSPSGTSNSAADTVAGEVIGTPAYMPPEQARGVDVDERADVYALGASLYHVLAGGPPFRGRSSEVLTALLTGPPPSLASQAVGIPRELLAIVARAMSHEAADRYASAAELGAELKRFQNGQLVAAHQYTAWELARRWVRKRKATVAVGAIALVALSGGGIVSVRKIVHEEQRARAALELAEHHHAEAARRGAEAERLVDVMLFKLYDKLQPIGRLDALDEVAQALQRYYDGHPEAATVDDQRKRALARRNLGNILLGKGDTPAALIQHQAALASFEALSSAAPDDRELAAELARSYLAVGGVRATQSRLADAGDLERRALAIATHLHDQAPGDLRWSRLLVLAHAAYGRLNESRGDLVAAVASHRSAIAAATGIAANGDDADQQLLSTSHDNLGDVLRTRGEREAAIAEYRAALAIDTAALASHPTDADRQRRLALGTLKIGNVLADTDAAGALASYRRAHELLSALVLRDPENAMWMRDLSGADIRIGDALAEPATAAAALASYRAANQLRRTLVAKDPSNLEWQRDLAVSTTKVATILEGTDQIDAAKDAYRTALAIAEKLAANAPELATANRDLVFIYTSLARIDELQHDFEGALGWLRSAVASTELVLTKDPKNVTPSDYVGLYYTRELIGDILVDQHQLAAADAAYAQAQAIAERRLVDDAANPMWKEKLGLLRTRRAACCKGPR